MASLALERAARIDPLGYNGAAQRDAYADWFAALYRDTVDSVYRFTHMLVGDHHAAEDVVAETYLRAWRARHRFDQRRPGQSWVLAIARNCAMDALRARQRLVDLDMAEEIEDTSFDLAPQELTPEQLKLLHDAISRLTPEQQDVIFLRFFEGLPHETVASRLGKNANAVRAIQFRALSRLRGLLEAANA